MNKIINNEPFETNSEEFRKKADRALSVINNINREGGFVTQLQMAAACIELQSFELYLLNTFNDNVIDINDFPDLSKLEEYIRLFKDAEADLWNDIVEHDNPEQRKKQEGEDHEIIFSLQELIINTERLREYVDCNDYLDSWKKIQTDIGMLLDILYVVMRVIILDFESIFQIIRKPKNGTKANTTSHNKRKNNFREYIIYKDKAEEIMGKLHRLMDNKKNTAAIRIINEAMWIDLIIIPSAPSIKEEFLSITCDVSYVNRKLDPIKPKKNGKVDEELLNKIREKFEQA